MTEKMRTRLRSSSNGTSRTWSWAIQALAAHLLALEAEPEGLAGRGLKKASTSSGQNQSPRRSAIARRVSSRP
jgi:hypothetical protein